MSLLDAFVEEPLSVNEPLIDSLLLEENSFEFFVAIGSGGGSGTVTDPYLVDTAAKFDQLISSFPPYTTIHLGPGLFPTQGHADGVSGGWQPKRGWRIVGAGIDVTTLKLSIATPTTDAAYFVIGGNDTSVINEFEASDMTIDCNMAGFGSAAVAAGAVKVFGTHVRIRRIRAIAFGTSSTNKQGTAIATAGAYPENPEPFDCVIEDCIIEQPFANNVRETACVSFAGGERLTDGVMAFHKSCVLRNCLIDCKYSSNEVAINDISIAGGVATVSTKTQHGLSNNAWVVITGALVNGSAANTYNGSYQISVVNLTTFTFAPVSPVPTVSPTGDMYIGRPSSHRTAIKSFVVSGASSPYTVTLETFTPHNRVAGNNVVVNNVLVSGSAVNAFNASFPITQIVSPSVLQFTINTNPGTPDVTKSYIGVDFYGGVTNGGRGIIAEGNRVLNTTFGLYRDSLSTRDMTVRDNYFYNVLAAVFERMGQVSGGNASQQPTRQGSALSRGSSPYLSATFSTSAAHGFFAGQAVIITGAYIGGNPAPAGTYNGIFKVTSVPTPTSFSYAMPNPPSADADGSPHQPYFGAVWQVGRMLIENNVIELVFIITPGIDLPTGLRMDRTASNPVAPILPYVFSQVFVRSNGVREVDNASDQTARRMVATSAGLGGQSGSTDGTSAARFNLPSGVSLDTAGNVYVADKNNSTIREVTAAGVVTTPAGLAGSSGSMDGTGSAARFSSPSGVAVDSAGNVYVADTNNHTIRKVTSGGVVTTLAGLAGSSGNADGTGSAARFNSPSGVAVDSAGNIYVADTSNHTIRKVTSGGVVTTLAGLAGSSGSTDGTGSTARFNSPSGVAVDSAGNIYVADANNHAIRKVTPGGVVTTLAGLAGSAGSTDGTGNAARFNGPSGVAVDIAGNVYVADKNNHTIRNVTSGGVVTTLAGLAGTSGTTDGAGSVARFSSPSGIAVDGIGNLFVADANNHTIRRLSAAPLAIYLNSCEQAIVENNVISLDRTHAIEFRACGLVKFFNNQSPSGGLIQGYDGVLMQFANELTTDADLSAILAS